MKGYTKLPKKKLYGILIPIGVMMVIASLEVMMKVKDASLFYQWVSQQAQLLDLTDSEMFDVYLTANMSLYFMKIVIPIGLGIHAYVAYTKIRINKIFVFIWIVLMAGSGAYSIMDTGFQSVFSFVYIVLYLIVIGTVFSLTADIDKSENH